MTNSLLITTALEETWEKNNNILFLGEWCKRPNREHYWTKLNFQTLPYHWNDRGKLQKDYLLSKIIYNQLILKLSQNFNSFHNTNYSNRYWKIILGPWLSSFIQLVLERYENLKQLKDKNYNLETVILDINKDLLLPSNIESYYRSLMTDTWNHFIFSEILKTSDHLKIFIKKR